MLLLSFRNIFIYIQVFIQEIYLFSFNGVFLIHENIYPHLRDVFIHIQRVIFVHIHDRNIHSTFSTHHLYASSGPSSRPIISERNMADEGYTNDQNPQTQVFYWQDLFFCSCQSPTRLRTGNGTLRK